MPTGAPGSSGPRSWLGCEADVQGAPMHLIERNDVLEEFDDGSPHGTVRGEGYVAWWGLEDQWSLRCPSQRVEDGYDIGLRLVFKVGGACGSRRHE